MPLSCLDLRNQFKAKPIDAVPKTRSCLRAGSDFSEFSSGTYFSFLRREQVVLAELLVCTLHTSHLVINLEGGNPSKVEHKSL